MRTTELLNEIDRVGKELHRQIEGDMRQSEMRGWLELLNNHLIELSDRLHETARTTESGVNQ